MEGELTEVQKHIVVEEAYVNGFYEDDVGVKTGGVGQTGEFLSKTFKESFEAHEDKARKLFKEYDNFDEDMQKGVMSAVYRGDAKSKYKWVKLVNKGEFEKAADEFLDNDEYRKRRAKGKDGVVIRMEKVSAFLRANGGK